MTLKIGWPTENVSSLTGTATKSYLSIKDGCLFTKLIKLKPRANNIITFKVIKI